MHLHQQCLAWDCYWGQISTIYHGVMALVNVQKWFLASSSFTIWNIMIKRHKYDLSNKSSILA